MTVNKKGKFLMSLIIITAFFLFYSKNIFSQSVIPPGRDIVNCGNAESDDPKMKKCCQPLNIITPAIPRVISESFPAISNILNIFGGFTDLLTRRENTIPCYIGYPSSDTADCVCLKESQITPTPLESSKELCERYLSGNEKNQCINDCAVKQGVWTAIGCIEGNLSDFIMKTIFEKGIGLAGFISLLCIIYAAFQMQTSAGSPEKIKKAQELLTSCIMGLMLIIFSVFILRLIGISILKIPGFR